MRPKHFDEYKQFTEVVPGVFVESGDSVYIVDNEGEVCSWNCDEWATDSESVTATINAIILATKFGPEAVRKNLEQKGKLISNLIKETYENSLR